MEAAFLKIASAPKAIVSALPSSKALDDIVVASDAQRRAMLAKSIP